MHACVYIDRKRVKNYSAILFGAISGAEINFKPYN